MRVKRIRIVMPAGSRDLAAHDARAIAEAVGRALAKGATAPAAPITVAGQGRHGAALADSVAGALPKGGRRGD